MTRTSGAVRAIRGVLPQKDTCQTAVVEHCHGHLLRRQALDSSLVVARQSRHVGDRRVDVANAVGKPMP